MRGCGGWRNENVQGLNALVKRYASPQGPHKRINPALGVEVKMSRRGI